MALHKTGVTWTSAVRGSQGPVSASRHQRHVGGPRGPQWGDTWTCPCAPQGLAKAYVPHPAGRPKGKIRNLHLGGGIPRDERRRQLPVYKIRTQGPETKNAIVSPVNGCAFWVTHGPLPCGAIRPGGAYFSYEQTASNGMRPTPAHTRTAPPTLATMD